MKKSAALIIAILFSLVLLNCGEEGSSEKTRDDSTSVEYYYSAKVVASIDDLPACDADTDGQMYYVQNLSEFLYCDGSSYQSADIGTAGPQGLPGDPGVDGLNSLILITNEDPGVNCTYGGKKIEVGLDANSNDILDPGEVDASLTTYICSANPAYNTWYGNAFINDADDITALSGYTVISGDVYIKDTDLANIDGLSGITTITGSITITDNPSLTSITGLNNITRASGITVSRNTILSSIAFDNLETATSLDIAANPQISSISCNSLVYTDSINVDGNDNLSSISFTALEIAYDMIKIGYSSLLAATNGNAILTTIDMGSLIETGALLVGDNDSLTTLTVSNLDTIWFLLSIEEHALLDTISFGSLCNVSSGVNNDAYKQFNVHDNASLCQSDVDSLKTQVVGCGGLNWLSEDISNNKVCP